MNKADTEVETLAKLDTAIAAESDPYKRASFGNDRAMLLLRKRDEAVKLAAAEAISKA